MGLNLFGNRIGESCPCLRLRSSSLALRRERGFEGLMAEAAHRPQLTTAVPRLRVQVGDGKDEYWEGFQRN
eukprot:236422-Rhodomonas_salina.1